MPAPLDLRIRPIGRPKITKDGPTGFQKVVRRYVVEGPKASKTGLEGAQTGDDVALFRPVGEQDVEFADHYLTNQSIEPGKTVDKAYLIREYVQLRDTWYSETVQQSTSTKKITRKFAAIRAQSETLGGYSMESWANHPSQIEVASNPNDPWDYPPEIVVKNEPTTVVEYAGESTAEEREVPMYNVTVESLNGYNTAGEATVTVGVTQGATVTESRGSDGALSFVRPQDPNWTLSTFTVRADSGIDLGAGQEFVLDADGKITLDSGEIVERSFLKEAEVESQSIPYWIAGIMEDNPPRWLRGPVVVDSSQPGVDLWTVQWSAPQVPYWTMGGGKKSASSYPGLVDFDHNGIKYFPGGSSSGINQTYIYTFFVVASELPFSIAGTAGGDTKPSVSMSIRMMQSQLMRSAIQIEKVFANTLWNLTTASKIKFPLTNPPWASSTFRAENQAQGTPSTKMYREVAESVPGAYIFKYSAGFKGESTVAGASAWPDVSDLSDDQQAARPHYQGIALMNANGHISWSRSFTSSGVNVLSIKSTPVTTYEREKIWAVQVTFA